MKDKMNKSVEKDIIVLVNGKEIDRISLKYAIKNGYTICNIVMTEIQKSQETKMAPKLFVYINGKNVKPRDANNIYIGDVESIEIFDKKPKISTIR